MGRGDHVRVKRVGYYHHGIEIGNNRVVHFTGEPGRKANASIQETSMDEFLDGGALETVPYARSIPVEETVEVATQHLGRTDYSLVFNNCEHFARYCKTKEHRSEQVEHVATNATASVGTGAAVAASVVAVSAAGSAAGLSGAGIMSGLAAIGPGGAIAGIGALAAVPAVVSNIAVSRTLKDDDHLPEEERRARKAGRVAAKVGTAAGATGAVGAVSVFGATAGLSAAGITSGLAAIGSTVGGGMAAGVAITIAAPAAAAALAGFGVYKLWGLFANEQPKQ